jgi:hypothetical protein
MQVFLLQQYGFRVIACADKTHYCWVEFYPNSPHFTFDTAKLGQLESWLKDWEDFDEKSWEISSVEKFPIWQQEVEDQVNKLPAQWSLISQTLFLAGLSAKEAIEALNLDD